MSTRAILLTGMRHLGLMRLWRYAQRGNIPILMFHGVVAAKDNGVESPLRRRLSDRDLEAHIQTLSRCFHFVPLNDAVDMLMGRRPTQPHSLVLTFDDGYLNNAAVAWPILKRHGVPATFFIATGHVGRSKFFWRDRLDYAVGHLRPGVGWLTVGGVRYSVPRDGDRAKLQNLFWQVLRACNALGWARAEEVIDKIEELATSKLADSPQSNHWARFMSWQQVRSMRRGGADFGSHSVSHHPLDEMSFGDVRRELENSRQKLESEIGEPCSAVAYPNGRVSSDVARAAQQAGYRCGLTTGDTLARMGDPPVMLPRLGVPRRPIVSADLLARTTGLSESLSRLRAHILPKTVAGRSSRSRRKQHGRS